MVLADSKGPLHRDREDLKADPRFYRKRELAEITNPDKFTDTEKAVKGSDVLISLSQPGPDTIPPTWVRSMADRAVVFAPSFQLSYPIEMITGPPKTVSAQVSALRAARVL